MNYYMGMKRVNTWAAAAAIMVSSFLVAGCADHEQQAMCPAYVQFENTYDKVAAADPTGATATEAADAVERASGELRQLRDTADERYSAQLDSLQRLLTDLERTLYSVNDEASYATWQPLVDDTLADVVRANARLRRAISPACGDRSDQALAPLSTSSWEKSWTA